MTESEFREHIIDLADEPDPDEQAAHFGKCCAILLNSITAWFGKPLFGSKTLIPWMKDAGRSLTLADVETLEVLFPVVEGVEVTVSEEDLALLKRYGFGD